MLKCRNDADMYSQLDNLVFVDVPKIISYDKVRMFMGLGYEFKHQNKEIHKKWERIAELNSFFDFMFQTEKFMSEMGAIPLTINKNMLGEPLLNVANPYFSNAIECCFSTSDFGVITSEIVVDNQMCLLREAYDTEKVVRTIWSGEQAVTKRQLNMYEYVAKLPKEKQIEMGEYDKEHNAYIFRHNLGFCPLVIMKNQPFRQFMVNLGDNFYFRSPYITANNYNSTGWSYSAIQDTAKCSGLIVQLQNFYTQMNKMGLLDKPRIVIGGLNQITANKLRQNKELLKSYLKDIMINTGNSGGDVKVVAPTNTLNYYYECITNTWKDIYRACGLSYTTQTSVQKTATESNSSYEQSLQEINFERTYHTMQWIVVLKRLFKMMGIDLGDSSQWSFQVKRNMVIDEASKLDSLIKQVQLGTKTPVQTIATLEGIDEDNANHIWEENKQWFEKNDFPIAMKEGSGVSGVKGASLPTSEEKGGRPEQDKGE